MQEEKQHSYKAADSSPYSTAGVLQIRLNTDIIIQDLEKYLSGKMVVYEQDEFGNILTKERSIGDPMMNEVGRQATLSWVRSMINPQTVQGNFKEEDYGQYLELRRKALCKFLMLNRHRFDIPIDYYRGIIDMIFSIVEPFMTRLIDNKERESYVRTLESREVSNSEVRGKGLNIPFFRG